MLSYLIYLFLGRALAQSSSSSSGSLNVCDGPYILCSTALCSTIPNNSSYVTCVCEGPYNGENIGPTTCDYREQYNVSSFSFDHEPSEINVYACEGPNAGPWADCNGALCDVQEGNITCACPLEVGDNLAFTSDACPTSEAEVQAYCATLRSTAMLGNSTEVTSDEDDAENDMEETGPTISFCDLSFTTTTAFTTATSTASSSATSTSPCPESTSGWGWN